jgi:hypothetical protein
MTNEFRSINVRVREHNVDTSFCTVNFKFLPSSFLAGVFPSREMFSGRFQNHCRVLHPGYIRECSDGGGLHPLTYYFPFSFNKKKYVQNCSSHLVSFVFLAKHGIHLKKLMLLELSTFLGIRNLQLPFFIR